MQIRVRTYSSERFFGALLAVAIFGMGMLFGSSQQSPSHQQHQSENNPAQSQAPQQNNSHWWGHSDPGVTAATVFLVLVGIAQAIMFYVQLSYMQKGMDDAKIAAEAAKAAAESAKSQAEAAKAQVALAKDQVEVTKIGIFDLERAYLAVGPTNITTTFKQVAGKQFYVRGDPLEVVIFLNVKNTGRTSAHLTKIYGEFSEEPPLGDTPYYEGADPVITDLAIGAGDADDLPMYQFRHPLVDSEPLFFWGYVEYSDIFRNKRTSRFCAAVFPIHKHKERGKYQIAGSDPWRHCD